LPWFRSSTPTQASKAVIAERAGPARPRYCSGTALSSSNLRAPGKAQADIEHHLCSASVASARCQSTTGARGGRGDGRGPRRSFHGLRSRYRRHQAFYPVLPRRFWSRSSRRSSGSHRQTFFHSASTRPWSPDFSPTLMLAVQARFQIHGT
jgi:hypothetical protein